MAIRVTFNTPLQTITRNDIRDAAFAAYKAGTLTAQLPSGDPDRACTYHGRKDPKGCVCAIGAVLKPEVHMVLDAIEYNSCHPVVDLVEANIIAFDSELTRRYAIQAQNAHDAWAMKTGKGRTDGEREQLFLAALLAWTTAEEED